MLAWMECQVCRVKLDRKDLLEHQDFPDLLAAKVTLVCLVMMVGREWMDYLDYRDRKVTLDSVVQVRKVMWGYQVRRVRPDYLESRESKDSQVIPSENHNEVQKANLDQLDCLDFLD